MKYKIDDYIGKKMGCLTVKGVDNETGWWIFKCVCGNEVVSTPYKIISGHKKSCGCQGKQTKDETPNEKGIVSRKKCERCGKEMQNVHYKQRFCKECTVNRQREYQRAYNELKELEAKEKAEQEENERKKKLSLKEISELAAKEHLTYGQYVAKYGL